MRNSNIWYKEFQYLGDTHSDSLSIFLGPIKYLNSTFLNGNLIGRKEHWGSNQGDVVYKISSKDLNNGKNVLAVRIIDVWGNAGFKKGVTPNILDDQNDSIHPYQRKKKVKKYCIIYVERKKFWEGGYVSSFFYIFYVCLCVCLFLCFNNYFFIIILIYITIDIP